MGKIISKLTRPMRNFNIESRAHKVISKDKPNPAPLHKANIEEAERLLRENPDSLNELLKKNTTLDNHLKSVYVKSHDPIVKVKNSQESFDRPLPLNRKIVTHFEFGYDEPMKVPIGKCTLRQALKFLTNHQEDQQLWNSTKIALDYNIPEQTIQNIITHFRIYKVHVPDKKSKVAIGEPLIPKQKLEKIDLKKLLDEGVEDKKK